jgi:hypothetical protein
MTPPLGERGSAARDDHKLISRIVTVIVIILLEPVNMDHRQHVVRTRAGLIKNMAVEDTGERITIVLALDQLPFTVDEPEIRQAGTEEHKQYCRDASWLRTSVILTTSGWILQGVVGVLRYASSLYG